MAYAPATTLDPTNVMGRRVAAWFIDVIIPTAAALIVGYIVFIGAATKVSNVPSDYCTFSSRPADSACIQIGDDAYVGTDDDAAAAITVGALVYLVGALNLFILQGLTGATAGKHMLGLRVVRADGRVAGFGANALRTLLLIVDQFFCALVGLITALATHPHRRVGDMAAGTYVVGKQSVGTPIATPMAAAPYPQWTPPGQPTWGPPPTGATQPWGAPTPGWGTPPAAGPPPAATPPAWGTPAATPPAASPPAASETVTDAPASDAPTEEAPGWGAPAAETTPPAAAPPVGVPPVSAPPPSREPQWDAQRNAWVYWEAETSRWLQFDAATGQWGPLR